MEETIKEMYQYETTYQPNDFFRVTDGVKTFIFNKKYIVSIDTTENSFKERVIVKTIHNHEYTLNMKIDDFIDQMEGRK